MINRRIGHSDPLLTKCWRSTHVLHRERTHDSARGALQYFFRSGRLDGNVRLNPETVSVLVFTGEPFRTSEASGYIFASVLVMVRSRSQKSSGRGLSWRFFKVRTATGVLRIDKSTGSARKRGRRRGSQSVMPGITVTKHRPPAARLASSVRQMQCRA
jgi:hypothetical protein